MSENVQIAIIAAVPATLIAIGGIIIPLVSMYKHRNHEATSDDTNEQVRIFFNGGFQERIAAEVQKQLKK